MSNKLKPALIGGFIVGTLSVIPFVNLANLCCCLWALLGGICAAYLYIKSSPTPATPADGAILGVFVGIIAGVIVLLLGIPIDLLARSAMNRLIGGLLENVFPEQKEMIRLRFAVLPTLGETIIQALISAVLLFVFSVVGGLLAIPIFEKRKGNTLPPPQPSNPLVGGGNAA
jgi:hypothetical protein